MNILYFAWVREAVGRDGEDVALPAAVETVADLLSWLATRGADYAVMRDAGKLRFAVDQQFVTSSARLEGASEVAIFPPVTGG